MALTPTAERLTGPLVLMFGASRNGIERIGTSVAWMPGMAEPETKAKKSSSKLIVIVALGAALASGIGGGFFLGSSRAEPKHAEEPEEVGDASAHPRPIVDLDPFIVNLAEKEQIIYLKCKSSVELASEAKREVVEARRVKLRHEMLLYLSGLRLSDTFGVENKKKIQSEMLGICESVLGKGAVTAIYLSEFVTQ
ncbi:MAG: flagellar basal body-associated FliL family protein [Deltaproteobacteria bacterium]|nr:flagellar basal body-associated FliL family protein [Deltaproteobacteria bacterium]